MALPIAHNPLRAAVASRQSHDTSTSGDDSGRAGRVEQLQQDKKQLQVFHCHMATILNPPQLCCTA